MIIVILVFLDKKYSRNNNMYFNFYIVLFSHIIYTQILLVRSCELCDQKPTISSIIPGIKTNTPGYDSKQKLKTPVISKTPIYDSVKSVGTPGLKATNISGQQVLQTPGQNVLHTSEQKILQTPLQSVLQTQGQNQTPRQHVLQTSGQQVHQIPGYKLNRSLAFPFLRKQSNLGSYLAEHQLDGYSSGYDLNKYPGILDIHPQEYQSMQTPGNQAVIRNALSPQLNATSPETTGNPSEVDPAEDLHENHFNNDPESLNFENNHPKNGVFHGNNPKNEISHGQYHENEIVHGKYPENGIYHGEYPGNLMSHGKYPENGIIYHGEYPGNVMSHGKYPENGLFLGKYPENGIIPGNTAEYNHLSSAPLTVNYNYNFYGKLDAVNIGEIGEQRNQNYCPRFLIKKFLKDLNSDMDPDFLMKIMDLISQMKGPEKERLILDNLISDLDTFKDENNNKQIISDDIQNNDDPLLDKNFSGGREESSGKLMLNNIIHPDNAQRMGYKSSLNYPGFYNSAALKNDYSSKSKIDPFRYSTHNFAINHGQKFGMNNGDLRGYHMSPKNSGQFQFHSQNPNFIKQQENDDKIHFMGADHGGVGPQTGNIGIPNTSTYVPLGKMNYYNVAGNPHQRKYNAFNYKVLPNESAYYNLGTKSIEPEGKTHLSNAVDKVMGNIKEEKFLKKEGKKLEKMHLPVPAQVNNLGYSQESKIIGDENFANAHRPAQINNVADLPKAIILGDQNLENAHVPTDIKNVASLPTSQILGDQKLDAKKTGAGCGCGRPGCKECNKNPGYLASWNPIKLLRKTK